MNILSFDTEEWYLEKILHGGRKKKYDEYDTYLDKILSTLDANNQKGTFFCVGKLVTDFPEVVRKIADKGHEIGCHSNIHTWLNKMTEKEMMRDTRDAVSALEDVSSQKVLSYRAPAFTIGEKNKWAIEILRECGIERDASIFPAKRAFGGFDAFPADNPVIIDYYGTSIKEFPICLTKICGKQLAFSGGGYFRFFPYNFIEKVMKGRDYNICYFHIGDLIYKKEMFKTEYEEYYKEAYTMKNRLIRYIKSNLGTEGAFDKMVKLLNSQEFINLEMADNLIDWSKAQVVKI